MRINIIVAYSKTHAIGKDNKLLWHLADDMSFFKKMTMGKVVVMGKNTYLSIPEKFRPLPNRTNIVISSQEPIEKKENLIWVKSIEEALEKSKELNTEEIFVIGGGQIYKSMLSITDCIYATEVDTDIEGDIFFPQLNSEDWSSEIIDSFDKNERNEFGFEVVKYVRK
jgi:dihydrofolate reductase